jgi:DNA uptake protein ComE-like DNA-binding protein
MWQTGKDQTEEAQIRIMRFLAITVLLLTLCVPIVAAAAGNEPLDLNTATEEELKALPGIGDAYSKDPCREPYRRMDELVEKKVVPQATYDKIKDQVVAKRK